MLEHDALFLMELDHCVPTLTLHETFALNFSRHVHVGFTRTLLLRKELLLKPFIELGELN